MIAPTAVPLPPMRPNNGMHPTPHKRAFHVSCVGARVMPGVRLRVYIDWVNK